MGNTERAEIARAIDDAMPAELVRQAQDAREIATRLNTAGE